MVEHVSKMPFKYDIEQIKKEAEQILVKHELKTNQLCFTYNKTDEDIFHDCTGTPYEKNVNQKIESTYSIFNDMFKDTIFHKIYNDVQDYTGGKVGRTRFMNLSPFSCIGIHSDAEIDLYRVHLAINTAKNILCIFPPSHMYHIPDDGNLYKFESVYDHTVINTRGCDRLHFVMNIYRH